MSGLLTDLRISFMNMKMPATILSGVIIIAGIAMTAVRGSELAIRSRDLVIRCLPSRAVRPPAPLPAPLPAGLPPAGATRHRRPAPRRWLSRTS